jgi:hypothetical protein
MSAAVLIVIALTATVIASLVSVRAYRTAIAALGLAACVVAALAAPPLTTIAMGEAVFALGTHGAGVAATAASSLLLLLGAAVARRERAPSPAVPIPEAVPMSQALPIAFPLVVAALVTAVAAIDGALLSRPTGGGGLLAAGTAAPPVAVAVVTAASVVLAPLAAWQSDPALAATAGRAAARAVPAAILACCLALAGMAWLLASAGPIAPDPAGAATALLLVGASVAVFMGALPFHAIVVRASVTGPIALAAARGVWLPAAFALAGVAWSQRVLAPSVALTGVGAASLFGEARAVIAIVALVTLAGGSLAATFHADLRHVLAYALVGDAGLALLAFASADPAAASAAATWLPVNAVARTAFVTWTVALAGRWGTGLVDDLDGWARGAPLLGIGLVGIAAATFGLPGWGMFALRSTLVETGAGALWPLMAAAAWLGLLPFLRLAWVGVRRRSEIVGTGAGPAISETRDEDLRGRRAPLWTGRVAVQAGAARFLAAWVENGEVVAAGVTLLAAALAVLLAWSAGAPVTAID